ncbi:MAG: choice-of-anchor L domain-containing protein, partial [Polyangiaceae bacterium]
GGNGSGALGGTNGDGGASGVCAPDPSNYDIPGNGCDDDDDGTVDNPETCDTGLDANGAAGDFVKALGVCQMADATHWGLVSATYTNGFGSSDPPKPTQHQIASSFGSAITPQEGASLGVLSTGFAMPYDNATSSPTKGQFKNNSAHYNSTGNAVPAGFPKAAKGCPDVTIDFADFPQTFTNDVVDVKLQLKAPNNAQGIAFDFNFYSGEWPDFVCSDFNDSFIAYLSSSAFNGGSADNMSFDSLNNPVSVNNGFFDRCTPGATLGCKGNAETAKSVCAGGEGELADTGFLNPKGSYGSCMSGGSGGTAGVPSSAAGGATGWLTSQAPVKPGETITIEFMIWNTGDETYDSSVLLDHLTWVPGAVVASTSRPR